MGLFTKDIQTMDDLFVHTLRDIYYAENQIVKALPEMIEKATDPQLKQGFQSHLEETRKQVDQFWEEAIAAGGQDNGGPGPRKHYHDHYYGAFVTDLDGNNVEAVCHKPE